ncbi:MAG: hypothetical protein LUE14_13345 [Clostridiales bacterium]|nr:hypothetical protein [Clostridiales bacterium]
MIEIKLKVDQIDYADAIGIAFPILKRRAQDSDAIWARVVREMNTPDESTIQRIMNLLPKKLKDEIAVQILKRYQEEIPGMLMSLADSKGISLQVTDVEISSYS